MGVHIDYSKRAQEQIRKLEKPVQRLLFAWIDKYIEGGEHPRQYGKALVQGQETGWRYRIGEYRLLARIQGHQLLILALEVSHQKTVK